MGFYEKFKEETDKRIVLTDNGAKAYATSGKYLLDFNFGVSAMRNMIDSKISDMFLKAFFEDKMIATKYLFYLGDARQGLGERKAFRAALKSIIGIDKELAKKILPLIPYYNRWDTILLYLDDDTVRPDAVAFIKRQLKEDRRNMKAGNPVSLCAKWMPSINASSEQAKKYARELCLDFGWTARKYRRRLSKLRAYLKVVEVSMSAKEWDKINYESVPSRANLIYNAAFLRNDEARRREYLSSLEKGEAKINAAVLNPHEIVMKYRARNKCDETLEALWKALPDMKAENTLIVRDGSASMLWARAVGSNARPLDVATALAIYMAEHNTGEWKDKFITFSANPKFIDLSTCKNLLERITYTMRQDECSNTDIYKTMRLILQTAVNNNLTKEEMPKMIVIISDMQFDGNMFHFNGSLFDNIKKMFEKEGYDLPRICFWNVAGVANGTIPMQKNDMGLILCSGFSVQIMRMFMSGKVDPYEVLLDVLNSERYNLVEETIKTYIG